MGVNLLLVSFSQEVSHYLTLKAQSFSNTDSNLAGTDNIAHF